MIDIIIPVYNEEEILILRKEQFLSMREKARLIFVDGGSQDSTVNVAVQYGEVVFSEKGRGIQKNEGAKCSKSAYLLFLHVDTFVDATCITAIEEALEKGADVGHMTLRVRGRNVIFRLFEGLVNWRARYWRILDGDLGLFVQKEYFERVGGFHPYSVLEDVLFSRKLSKKDNVVMLPNVIHVSSRKWRKDGFLKTFFRYTGLYCHLWTNFRFYKGADFRE